MKKILFFIIAILAMVSPCHADTWDGISSDTSWYVEGLSEYHIENAAQLKGLADLVNNQSVTFDGCTVTLGDDIDLNNHLWIPIGYENVSTQSVTFNGIFDGQGYTINNLNIFTKDLPYNWEIMNLGFFGTSNGEISNLSVNGELNIGEGETVLASFIYIGGIVGKGHDVKNCKANITMNFNDMHNLSGTIATSHIGLVAGMADNIECAKSSGATWFYDSGYWPHKGRIGAIAGKAGYIDQCSSDAYIAVPGLPSTFYDICVGGIVGESSSVSNAIFTGTISVYNRGMATDRGIFLAGISSGIESTNISNCIFAPKEFKTNVGADYYGMIAPTYGNQHSVTDSYYLSEYASSTELYGTGVDESFLKSGANITNFNNDVWEFKEGSYPTLKALKSTYTISVPVSDGQIGVDILEGENITISIKPEAGWELQTLYVDGDDCTYLMNGNRYTFENVTSNHTVSAVFAESATGIQNIGVEKEKVSLKISDRRILLSGVDVNTDVDIYAIDGKLIKKVKAEKLSEIQFCKGIYIIKIGTDSFKINL